MANRYAYLVCVNAGNNNYKYYEMESDGYTLICKYGRVNSTCQTKSYPASRFDSIYRQKIGKGYVDKTEYYRQQTVEPAPEEKEEEVEVEAKQPEGITAEQFELYSILSKYTNKTIDEVFANGGTITKAMAEASEAMLEELQKWADHDNLAAFNEVLMNLMAICPRQVNGTGSRGVASWLADSSKDYVRILDREESLVQTMKSKVAYKVKAVNKSGQKAGYIKDAVRSVTGEEMQEIKAHLPYELRMKVRAAYRVEPTAKTASFQKWCKDNNIKRTKLLWHGSRNENWLSIIENSLQLRPNAVITGKMFGYGIYFATDAMKSWGYTSSGKWTGYGKASMNIMGLYETAYGKPYNCYYSEQMTQKKLDNMGCNCLHAHKRDGRRGVLHADEIVYYHEDAMCLKYLVIFNK